MPLNARVELRLVITQKNVSERDISYSLRCRVPRCNYSKFLIERANSAFHEAVLWNS